MQGVMNTTIKTTTILLSALLSITFVSCDLLFGIDKKPSENFDVLEEGSFYAQNIETEKYYKVKAEKLVTGSKCVIWAEKDARITKVQAQAIADEYDIKIRDILVDTFSKKNFIFEESGITYPFDDMLDFANWLAGKNDRKLTVLLLDIKDGFKDPETDSYVAGYFFSGNFYPPGKIPGTGIGRVPLHYSNGRDMIYVDTYPGLQMKPEQTYATFAHELQHLINFVTSVQMNRINTMNTWIDEGLSTQAEHLYLGTNLDDKIEWFSEDPAETIAKGNNFFVWGNNTGNRLSILDEYATVYLFFRWLYLQADESQKPDVFYDIITADNADYRAVTNVAKKINPEWDKWEPLLRTWLAANYFPKNSYGYTGDDDLREKIKVNPIGVKTIQLCPGEGVYSIIDKSFTPPASTSATANIRYADLSANTNINLFSPYTGNILLTFNTSTSNSGTIIRTETGTLTGITPSPSASRMTGEAPQSKKVSGPYVIDARDILGRDRW
jgi:hypothetical protein